MTAVTRTMLQRLLPLVLLVSPTALFALGLGDIQLHSALNQPLSAEIELLGATQDELGSLKANLASRETFARYGIEPSAQLTALDFKVGRNSQGEDVLRVTSRAPINDAFLTFLVEVNWSRGRLLREYTLLLDPPVYLPGEKSTNGEASSSVPIAAPQTETQQQPRPAPAPRAETSTPPSAPGTSSAPVAAQSGGSYTVRPNDTLSQIAGRLQPGSATDANRMMVALYRANPQAFAGNNINNLRSGSILRVPDSSAVDGISAGEARAEVRRQYADWRASRGTAPEASPAASEASRLRLVTPTERSDSAGTTAAGSAAAKVADGKVKQLEDQLAESRRLLQIKEAELAQLQKQASQKPAAVPPPIEAPVPESAQPVTPPPAATEAPAPSSEATPPAEQTAQPATPPAAEPPAPPKPEAPKAQEPAPAEASMVDWLIEHWYYPLAALLILGGIALGLIRKRREPDFGTLDRLATQGGDDADDEPSFSREPITARARPQPESTFVVEESGEHQRPQFKAAFDEPVREQPRTQGRVAEVLDLDMPESKPAEDTLSSETAINLDQGDPLAEADFHMAYGLYDQAADLVRIAIEREPNRRDLRLKLLEIFFVWGNKDAFLQVARQLHDSAGQASAGEWDKIVIMGKQICPDDPLFARAGSGAAAAADVDLSLEGGENRIDLDLLSSTGNQPRQSDGIDLDLGGALGDDSIADTGESPALKEEDAGLDFMLDEPVEDKSGATTREMPGRVADSPTVESEAWRPDSPTVESLALRDRASSTIKEKVDSALFNKSSFSPDQTAELAIDDLGLDLGALQDMDNEPLEALEDTAHPRDDLEETDHPSDAATMLAGMDEKSRRQMEEAERRAREREDNDKTVAASTLRPQDHSPTGTWILADKGLPIPGSNDETMRAPVDSIPSRKPHDIDATSELKSPGEFNADDMDLDLDRLEAALTADTIKQPRKGSTPDEQFSTDVFGKDDFTSTDIDLDLSAARRNHDPEPTATERIPAVDMELPELEPVTMSEVGTKLDLARAYMDMGDPEGARSILDEVLQEGTATQKQEAQRLLESLPG